MSDNKRRNYKLLNDGNGIHYLLKQVFIEQFTGRRDYQSHRDTILVLQGLNYLMTHSHTMINHHLKKFVS
jgi:hypothetical protein